MIVGSDMIWSLCFERGPSPLWAIQTLFHCWRCMAWSMHPPGSSLKVSPDSCSSEMKQANLALPGFLRFLKGSFFACINIIGLSQFQSSCSLWWQQPGDLLTCLHWFTRCWDTQAEQLGAEQWGDCRSKLPDLCVFATLQENYRQANFWSFDCTYNYSLMSWRVSILTIELRSIWLPQRYQHNNGSWFVRVGVPGTWQGANVTNDSWLCGHSSKHIWGWCLWRNPEIMKLIESSGSLQWPSAKSQKPESSLLILTV